MSNFQRGPKGPKTFKNDFSGVFRWLFDCKWCAALSFVFSVSGPEGQVHRVNAEQIFQKCAHLVLYISGTYVANEYLQQNPQYVKLKNHAFKVL